MAELSDYSGRGECYVEGSVFEMFCFCITDLAFQLLQFYQPIYCVSFPDLV